MKKHTYSLAVLVCTWSTSVEDMQQWIAQDDPKHHPLPALR